MVKLPIGQYASDGYVYFFGSYPASGVSIQFQWSRELLLVNGYKEHPFERRKT